MIKDIRFGEDPSYPISLENVNGTVYFAASDGVVGREVWKSDGSSEVTVAAMGRCLSRTSIPRSALFPRVRTRMDFSSPMVCFFSRQ